MQGQQGDGAPNRSGQSEKGTISKQAIPCLHPLYILLEAEHKIETIKWQRLPVLSFILHTSLLIYFPLLSPLPLLSPPSPALPPLLSSPYLPSPFLLSSLLLSTPTFLSSLHSPPPPSSPLLSALFSSLHSSPLLSSPLFSSPLCTPLLSSPLLSPPQSPSGAVEETRFWEEEKEKKLCFFLLTACSYFLEHARAVKFCEGWSTLHCLREPVFALTPHRNTHTHTLLNASDCCL